MALGWGWSPWGQSWGVAVSEAAFTPAPTITHVAVIRLVSARSASTARALSARSIHTASLLVPPTGATTLPLVKIAAITSKA